MMPKPCTTVHSGARAAGLLTLLILGGCWPADHCPLFSRTQTVKTFSDADYAVVLKRCVTPSGMVNYSALSDNKVRIDQFMDMIARLDPRVFETFSRNRKIAFWINVFNARVLQVTADRSNFANYPPKSVNELGGMWKVMTFTVMGKDMILDDLYRTKLSAMSCNPSNCHDARALFALTYAAKGSGKMRAEPYRADTLDAQLDEQVQDFLSTPTHFRIDRKANTIFLSELFYDNCDTFTTDYTGTSTQINSPAIGAVIEFISGYLNEADRHYLKTKKYRISFIPFDWSLNNADADK